MKASSIVSASDFVVPLEFDWDDQMTDSEHDAETHFENITRPDSSRHEKRSTKDLQYSDAEMGQHRPPQNDLQWRYARSETSNAVNGNAPLGDYVHIENPGAGITIYVVNSGCRLTHHVSRRSGCTSLLCKDLVR